MFHRAVAIDAESHLPVGPSSILGVHAADWTLRADLQEFALSAFGAISPYKSAQQGPLELKFPFDERSQNLAMRDHNRRVVRRLLNVDLYGISRIGLLETSPKHGVDEDERKGRSFAFVLHWSQQLRKLVKLSGGSVVSKEITRVRNFAAGD